MESVDSHFSEWNPKIDFDRVESVAICIFEFEDLPYTDWVHRRSIAFHSGVAPAYLTIRWVDNWLIVKVIKKLFGFILFFQDLSQFCTSSSVCLKAQDSAHVLDLDSWICVISPFFRCSK